MKLPLILLFVLFTGVFSASAQEWLSGDGWDFIGSNGGVTIYTRINPETGRYEAKATYTFVSQGEKYLNRLRVRWMDIRFEDRITNYPKDHRILAHDSTSRVVYMIPDLPFFVKEREIIVKQSFSPLSDGRGLVSHAKAEPTLLPPNEEFIRVESFSAVWVARMDGEKMQLALRFNIDPGGNAPEAMLRKFVEGGAERDVLRLVEILRHDDWFVGFE